jgi:hypothetical protein
MPERTGIGTFHSNEQTGMTTGMELISMLTCMARRGLHIYPIITTSYI